MRRPPEPELLFLAAFAAAPLYFSQAVSPLIVAAFHFGLGVAALIVSRGGAPGAPRRRIGVAMRIAAVLYLPVFAIDALTSSLIRASVHLLFFIAFYQAVDEKAREARNQRLLVVFLLFVTSLATSTHQTVLLYVIAFTVAIFARLILASGEDSYAAIGRPPQRVPVVRSALWFALPTAAFAALLFPALPRVQNPMVRGLTTGLDSASTGISESIDFSEARRISSDPMAVARVFMARDALPFFTPMRLRATVYDGWRDGKWIQKIRRRSSEIVEAEEGHVALARPAAFSRAARIEQKTVNGRLLLPEGTVDVVGFDRLEVIEPYATAFHSNWIRGERVRGEVQYEVVVSRDTRPLRARPATVVDYPVTPQVRALAMQVARNARTERQKAAVVASWLETNFTYIPDPSEIGRAYTVDEFLLSIRRGHCEYFAAGMVVMLAALDVPSRIVGGYYGGKLNPLIGSLTFRERDVHAWVEVYDGEAWLTYDPTPPDLRPGAETRNLLRAYASALADSIAYFWDRYILTFGSSDQVELLARAFYAARNVWRTTRANMWLAVEEARANAWRIAAVILLAASSVVLIFVLARRRSDYERLLRILRDLGIEAGETTAPRELLGLVRELRPDLAMLVEPVIEAYLRDRFAPTPAPETLRAEAARALRQLASVS
ncbi:MAG TPA: transglutaminaseTgpA domain-containing protein [Thermoanaerobaculia bacterium]